MACREHVSVCDCLCQGARCLLEGIGCLHKCLLQDNCLLSRFTECISAIGLSQGGVDFMFEIFVARRTSSATSNGLYVLWYA